MLFLNGKSKSGSGRVGFVPGEQSLSDRKVYRSTTLSEERSSSKLRKSFFDNAIYPIAALILATVIVYFPILGNDFLIYWDDKWQVMNYYTEGGIHVDNFRAIVTEFYYGQYSPLNAILYVFIYTLFGYNPLVFHLVSLLLHTGCVCLVYWIVRRIFKQTNRIHIRQAPAIAWITALIFAVHPMNVEAVAWISASKILVYSFFFLVASYTYMLFLDHRKPGFYILTLILFILSFGGKEQAVVFPVWLVMLYGLLGYSLESRRVWVQVVPFFLLALFFGIVTMLSNAASGTGILSDQASFPLWQRLVLCCYSLFEYIAKFIFPYNLLYLYPFPILIGEALPAWMLFYPAFIAVIGITLHKYILKWPVAIGLMFFIINMALLLHIIPMPRFTVVADRYMYLPCIGLAFIVAYYFTELVISKRGMIRSLIIGGFTGFLLYFCIYSNFRSRDWKDTDSIKKELRELIKNRKDYVSDKVDNLLENE